MSEKTEEKKSEFPFVHKFKGPGGSEYTIKLLGKNDATYFGPSTKRIIKGPGIVMEEFNGGNIRQMIVSGCNVEFLADNYSKAEKMAKERITC